MTDERTENELITEALQVQDACNLCGIVQSFARGMLRLMAIKRENGFSWSTTDINQHRYSRLFASKIESLTGKVQLHDFDEI